MADSSHFSLYSVVIVMILAVNAVKHREHEGFEAHETSKKYTIVAAPEPFSNSTKAFSLRRGPAYETEHPSLLASIAAIPHRLYNEIAVNVTYNGFLEEFETFPERRPRAFNILMATVKTWLADFIVQLGERRTVGSRWSFDWKRSAAFACFGCFYVGMVQWILYVSLFTRVCPNAIEFANAPFTDKLHDRAGQIDLVKQVCYDNFILETFIYFPVFYIIRELCNGTPPAKPGAEAPRRSLTSSMYVGLTKYAWNFRQDNLASWAVWVPADVVVYAVPMFMRMPLDHAVSFGWTMLLSHMRGSQH